MQSQETSSLTDSQSTGLPGRNTTSIMATRWHPSSKPRCPLRYLRREAARPRGRTCLALRGVVHKNTNLTTQACRDMYPLSIFVNKTRTQQLEDPIHRSLASRFGALAGGFLECSGPETLECAGFFRVLMVLYRIYTALEGARFVYGSRPVLHGCHNLFYKF